MDWLLELVEPAQIWLFQQWLLPALYASGLMGWADEVFDATGLFLLALCEILLLYILLRPLENWRPAEARGGALQVRTDVLYTFLYRTGALPLLFFMLLDPVVNALEVKLHGMGIVPPNLEDLLPVLHQQPLLAFIVYVVVIDFFEYWRHRLQHRFDWWWALHAVHHSQQNMTLWTDERNHLLDGLIQSLWMVMVALLIGVPGTQFIGIVFLIQAVESLSHTNVRLHFGVIGNRLLVSPCFHRIHHAIGTGHEGKHRGCNFAVLLPLWDQLFGSANHENRYPITGIRDQLQGVDYGRGFLEQQLLGMKRLAIALGLKKQGQ